MQAISTPLWDAVTFDPLTRITWLGLEGDGLAYVDTKSSFMQLRWLQNLRANHLTIVADGMGWLSSVPDKAAVRINTWLNPGQELLRVPFEAGARASAVCGLTGTVSFVLTNGSVAVLNSASGAPVGAVRLTTAGGAAAAHALQSPCTDGEGNLFVAMPYDNKARAPNCPGTPSTAGCSHASHIAQVAKINLRAPGGPAVAALWDTRPCFYPTGMAIDIANDRLFVGCAVRPAHRQSSCSAALMLSRAHAGCCCAHAGGAGHVGWLSRGDRAHRARQRRRGV
jgi:hypothetical protein